MRQLLEKILDAYYDKCDIQHPDGSSGEDHDRDLVTPILALITEQVIAEREACAGELLEAEYLLHDMMGANYYPDLIINQHGQNDPRSYVYANAAMYFAKKEEARLLLSENKEEEK